MRRAIREAERNMRLRSGGPFGACIVMRGKILAVARNTVLTTDSTAHAEINAIRRASRLVKKYNLAGCQIYSTTEPCPMCFSAIHWARIGVLVYGTSIGDAKRCGFNELCVSARHMKRAGRSGIKIFSAFLKNECSALLDTYAALPDAETY